MRFRSLLSIGIALCGTMVTGAAVPQPAPVMDVSFFQAKAMNASLSSAPHVPMREHYDTDEEFIESYLDWEDWYNDANGGGNSSSSSSAAVDLDDDWYEWDNYHLLQPRDGKKLAPRYINLSQVYHLPQPRPKPTTIRPLAHQYPYWTPTKCFGGELVASDRALARAKMADRINRNSKTARGAPFDANRVWREYSGTVLYYLCSCRPAIAIDSDWHITLEDFDRMEEFVVQDCGTQLGRAYNIEKQIKMGIALTNPWWNAPRLCNIACYNNPHQDQMQGIDFLDRYKKQMLESGPEEGWQYTGHTSRDHQ